MLRYIIDGSAEFVVDGETVIVRKGQVSYIPEGCWLSCKALEDTFAFYSIRFIRVTAVTGRFFLNGLICMYSSPFFGKVMDFEGACQLLRPVVMTRGGRRGFLFRRAPLPEACPEKGLRPRGIMVAFAHRRSPMTFPVNILSALAGLSLAGGVHARVWTNDRGATVTAALVAVLLPLS